jgi:hypothetical protein
MNNFSEPKITLSADQAASTTPLRALVAATGWKPPAALVKSLRTIENQHSIGMRRLTDLSEQSVGLLYLEKISKNQNALAIATVPSDLAGVALASKGTLLTQLNDQRHGVKTSLRTLSAAGHTLIKAPLLSFVERATAHVGELRQAEQKIALGYGVAHQDSATILQLAEHLKILSEQLNRQSLGYGSPTAITNRLFDL